jgi:hypothetical protein
MTDGPDSPQADDASADNWPLAPSKAETKTVAASSAGWGIVANTETIMALAPAQFGSGPASQVICGNDTAMALATMLEIVLGILVMVFLFTGMFRGAFGFNKKGSTKQQKVQEGDEQIQGAGYSVLAAATPALFFLAIEVAGFGVIQCLVPEQFGGASGTAMFVADWIIQLAAAGV